jgi:hypothetical protein
MVRIILKLRNKLLVLVLKFSLETSFFWGVSFLVFCVPLGHGVWVWFGEGLRLAGVEVGKLVCLDTRAHIETTFEKLGVSINGPTSLRSAALLKQNCQPKTALVPLPRSFHHYASNAPPFPKPNQNTNLQSL